jgi:Protein of unknown function (DUF3313)
MRALAILAIMLMLVGCGSSRRAKEVEPQGFLGDYSMLMPGEDGEAVLRYVNTSADWSKYNKVLVEPVAVLGSPGTREIPSEDLQTAANFLYAQLREELGQDFELVDVPGPDTLRVAAALTDAAPANQTMVVVSNLVPLAMATSGAYEYITGEPTFQGEAAAEARITDAQTGELLAAAVDKRMGGRTLSSAETSWTDVNNILAYWAQLTRFRLCEQQGRGGCERLKTGGL